MGAPLILLNPQILINSVDLTGHIDSVKIDQTAAELDTTTFGNTAKRRQAGLLDTKITLEFQQDESLSSVEATIAPLIGLTTTVVVFPVNGTVSTTNPSYTMSALVTQWQPISGKVGDISKISVTWPIDGVVTKAI